MRLSRLLVESGQVPAVLDGYRRLLRTLPDDLGLLNDTAWVLATSPDAALRNGTDSIAFAERAVELSKGRDPRLLDTLAAAYAEAGRFTDAVTTAHKALDLATKQNAPALEKSLQAELSQYEAGRPFREPAASPSGGSGQP